MLVDEVVDLAEGVKRAGRVNDNLGDIPTHLRGEAGGRHLIKAVVGVVQDINVTRSVEFDLADSGHGPLAAGAGHFGNHLPGRIKGVGCAKSVGDRCGHQDPGLDGLQDRQSLMTKLRSRRTGTTARTIATKKHRGDTFGW